MAVKEEECVAVPMALAALGAPLSLVAPEGVVALAAPEVVAVPAGALHGCGKMPLGCQELRPVPPLGGFGAQGLPLWH